MATASERAAKLQASIEAQAKRLAETKAKKARIEALARSKEKAAERKLETRRSVLMGAFVREQLTSAGHDPVMFSPYGKQFGTWLKRPEERLLFGLDALDEGSKKRPTE